MTEAKHTPGPWKVTQTEPPGDYVIHAKGIPWQLAYVPASTQIEWPLEANARLIAAAPDMLAALRAARSALDRLYDGFLHNSEAGCDAWDDASGFEVGRQLDAAIAKSEGRPA